ncbi:MAG TPA: class I SAM-dependent methyltransferase [Terriglobales bacterium]|nr:class I SAM-dependent methyltransferase [Terriglobales bacterium]
MHNFVLYSYKCLLYSGPVACTATPPDLKIEVAEFWNTEPCGTRYLGESSSFTSHSQARYLLEPHIPEFAGFASACGLRVLEIGVGIGADYEQWLRAGALATGVDISKSSLECARRRCELAGFTPDLHLADAENLPFPSESFDRVYSYGVMHHSPDTGRCIQEALRVLKAGGEARIMLYHHVSLTGIMLWLRYGIWRAQSIRQCVYEKLESPGTKTFTRDEVLNLMRGFEDVSIDQVFSPGDLLLHQPSQRFRGTPYRMLFKLFPRTLVRKFGRKWGLFLLISAVKPSRACN